MSNFIDAEKLIAEIERRIEETKSMKPSFNQFWAGQISAFKGVKTIITSFQQEQPEAVKVLSRPFLPSNLDEEAEEWCKRNNKGIALCADKKSHYLAEGMDAFKVGAEWMAGQFQKIEGKLVDWYETNGVDYCHGISTNESFEVPEGFYIRKK